MTVLTWTEATEIERAEGQLYIALGNPADTIVVRLHGFPIQVAQKVANRAIADRPGWTFGLLPGGAPGLTFKHGVEEAHWLPGGAHPRAPLEWSRQSVYHTDDYSITDSIYGPIRARKAGKNGIDANLTMTKDGVLVVNHFQQIFKHGAYDPTGKYKKGDAIKISQMTWADVQKHVRTSRGESIPTAVMVAKVAADHGVYVDFEAKGDARLEHPEPWKQLARQIQQYAPTFRGTVMSLPRQALRNAANANSPSVNSIRTLWAAGAAGWVTMLIGRGNPAQQFYELSKVSLIKNNSPSLAAQRRYGTRALTARGAKFYA